VSNGFCEYRAVDSDAAVEEQQMLRYL